MMVKIMLENTEDLRWVAVLLDKEVPKDSPDLVQRAFEVQPRTATDPRHPEEVRKASQSSPAEVEHTVRSS
jgi:hypothetical protein